MEVFLLIPIMLSLMGIVTDCAPDRKKKLKVATKKVKFNDETTIMWNSFASDPNEYPVFHMVEKDFKMNVQKKSELYKESSIERNFIRTIANVIQCNHRMYETLYRCVKSLNGDDTELYQFKRDKQPEDDSVKCRFPTKKKLDELKKDKESFQGILSHLFSLMEPTYEMNEHLFHMMNSMDADTKIDSELYKEMVKEAEKVVKIHDSFGRAFYNQEVYNKMLKESSNGGEIKGSLKEMLHDNPIEAYRENLVTIRKVTNMHENFEVITKKLKVGSFCPFMGGKVYDFKETLKKASKIDFDELYRATEMFHSIVVKALKIDEDA